MNVVAIIQARYESTRFPGKVLKDLGGKPVLKWVVDRTRKAQRISKVVVATSDQRADNEIEAYCRREDIPVVRGPEHDVLKRFVIAGIEHRADVVVRITSDCPLIDPSVIDRIVAEFDKSKADYASNTLRYTYPDGLDCEVMTFAALREADSRATAQSEREHVTPYIKNGAFKKVLIESDYPASAEYRLTVDHPQDLEMLNALYNKLGEEHLSFMEILKTLKENPQIARMNSNIVSNEGYYTSLADEGAQPLGYSYAKSTALYHEIKEIIPDASQTFSKGPSQVSIGASPFFLERGKGPHVWDVDGNRYIDLTMALGPGILGYSDEQVNAAVVEQIGKLTVGSLSSPLEAVVARKIIEHVPCAEMVRFGKNGSDVTAAAVRVSRAFTGRERVLMGGYHGWQDWYVATTARRLGVPKAVQELSDTFVFNDIDSLKRKLEAHPKDVAAVILEPVTAEPPKDGYLQEVIDLTHHYGALVIFDEVVTGFRLGLGGAQKHYGVKPDLACFGKALANGFPLSAIAGRKDVMSFFEKIFFSFTMGGELASLAAASAVIARMENEPIFQSIWEQGKRLLEGFQVLLKHTRTEDLVSIHGLPPKGAIAFKGQDEARQLLMKTYFQQECVKRGLLFSGVHLISYSHTSEVIDQALRIYGSVLKGLRENLGRLDTLIEGQMLKPVFRKV